MPNPDYLRLIQSTGVAGGGGGDVSSNSDAATASAALGGLGALAAATPAGAAGAIAAGAAEALGAGNSSSANSGGEAKFDNSNFTVNTGGGTQTTGFGQTTIIVLAVAGVAVAVTFAVFLKKKKKA